MNPNQLQKQLRDNASDYNDFYKELKVWGEEMKRREEQLKNNNSENSPAKKHIEPERKPKRTVKTDNAVKSKKKTTDYSAWDKFDADSECQKIDQDENDESELTDEFDGTQKEEAFLEKEKGNKFVKMQKWEDAIPCYSKAINLYGYDPIFYANRALCHIKLNNMSQAEADCTLSIKLDKTYVKAYQRRAAAREALNRLEEAQMDLQMVLDLEPNNKESLTVLEKLRKKLSENKPRPISKFTASRRGYGNNFQQQIKVTQDDVVAKGPNFFAANEEDIILVKTINKPVHMRSSKPLTRIAIEEIDGIVDSSGDTVPKNKSLKNQHEAFPSATGKINTIKTDDLKVIERKEPVVQKPKVPAEPVSPKEVKNHTNIMEKTLGLTAPKSSVQFSFQWKQLRTLDAKYAYLKLIKPEELPLIFKESFESEVFTQVLEILCEFYVNNKDKVYDFLLYCTEMKRFSTFTMFMSQQDKKYLWKLLDYVKDAEGKSEDEVQFLIDKYELQVN